MKDKKVPPFMKNAIRELCEQVRGQFDGANWDRPLEASNQLEGQEDRKQRAQMWLKLKAQLYQLTEEGEGFSEFGKDLRQGAGVEFEAREITRAEICEKAQTHSEEQSQSALPPVLPKFETAQLSEVLKSFDEPPSIDQPFAAEDSTKSGWLNAQNQPVSLPLPEESKPSIPSEEIRETSSLQSEENL